MMSEFLTLVVGLFVLMVFLQTPLVINLFEHTFFGSSRKRCVPIREEVFGIMTEDDSKHLLEVVAQSVASHPVSVRELTEIIPYIADLTDQGYRPADFFAMVEKRNRGEL